MATFNTMLGYIGIFITVHLCAGHDVAKPLPFDQEACYASPPCVLDENDAAFRIYEKGTWPTGPWRWEEWERQPDPVCQTCQVPNADVDDTWGTRMPGFASTQNWVTFEEDIRGEISCPRGYKRLWLLHNGDKTYKTDVGPYSFWWRQKKKDGTEYALVFCIPCDKGAWGNGKDCLPCAKGTFMNRVGADAGCYFCPKNTYQPWTYQVACEPCPGTHAEVRTFSPVASSSQKDCQLPPLCAAGKYHNSPPHGRQPSPEVDCTVCGVHSESTAGQMLCWACDKGKASQGNVRGAPCVDCLRPFVWVDWNQPCKCIAGFSQAPDGLSCTTCKWHTYSKDPGSAACTKCPAGEQTTEARATGCKACPANSGSLSGEPCVCFIGYEPVESGGAYLKECKVAQRCLACDAGKFSNTSDATRVNVLSCVSCPSNSSSAKASDDITDCKCDAGHTGPDGGPCTACVAGTYKSSSGTCATCLANSFSLQAASKCTCNVGYRYASASAWSTSTCTACPSDTYKDYVSGDINKQDCIDCPYYTRADMGSTSLDSCKCDRGYELNPASIGQNDKCKPCAAGTFKDGLGDRCANCPDNSYTENIGTCSIHVCLLNSRTKCVCNAGYKGPDGGPCVACDAGKYKEAAGDSACLDCPAPGTSPAASTLLADCKCNKGYTGPVSGSCQACTTGTYKDALGSAACSNCPAPGVSLTASTASTDCKCNAGHTGPDGVSCSACDAGWYKGGTGSAACQACTPYSTSPARSTSASACVCNSGFFGNGVDGCFRQCPAGYTGSTGVCVQCATGKYKETFGSAECTGCFDTSFMESGIIGQNTSAQCKCPAGTVQEGSICVKCAAGKFNSAAASSTCHVCYVTSGTCMPSTSTQLGASSCPGICRVPAGWQVVGSDGVQACPVNHYNDGSKLFCTECPWPASESEFGELIAGWKCQCQPGYWRVTWDAACIGVGLGFWKNLKGDGTSRQQCPADSSTVGTTSTSLSDCKCKAGFEKNGDRCVACAAGKAKHILGDQACIQCPPSSQLPVGAEHTDASCVCNAGYSGAAGSCAACLLGFFKNATGPAACTPCTDFATTPLQASTARTECVCIPAYEDGGSGPKTELGTCVSSCGPGTTKTGLTCVNCESGKFKDSIGAHPCSLCSSPRNASRAGSQHASKCSCRAGEVDVGAGQVATVVALGAYTETALLKTWAGSTDDECWSSLVVPDAITALSVNVLRHTGTVTLFACTSAADCAQQRKHNVPHILHGVCGRIDVQMTPQQAMTLSWYTGRAVQTTPEWTTDAAVRRSALRTLLPGDYLFGDTWLSTQPTLCVPCPPGMLCAESI